jgi:hypothetical protein
MRKKYYAKPEKSWLFDYLDEQIESNEPRKPILIKFYEL